jgi:hypothetical protein
MIEFKRGSNTSSSSLDKIEPENKPLRILFLSSDTGGGHRASGTFVCFMNSLTW